MTFNDSFEAWKLPCCVYQTGCDYSRFCAQKKCSTEYTKMNNSPLIPISDPCCCSTSCSSDDTNDGFLPATQNQTECSKAFPDGAEGAWLMPAIVFDAFSLSHKRHSSKALSSRLSTFFAISTMNALLDSTSWTIVSSRKYCPTVHTDLD